MIYEQEEGSAHSQPQLKFYQFYCLLHVLAYAKNHQQFKFWLMQNTISNVRSGSTAPIFVALISQISGKVSF